MIVKYQSFLVESEGYEGMNDSEVDDVDQFLLELSGSEKDFSK